MFINIDLPILRKKRNKHLINTDALANVSTRVYCKGDDERSALTFSVAGRNCLTFEFEHSYGANEMYNAFMRAIDLSESKRQVFTFEEDGKEVIGVLTRI